MRILLDCDDSHEPQRIHASKVFASQPTDTNDAMLIQKLGMV